MLFGEHFFSSSSFLSSSPALTSPNRIILSIASWMVFRLVNLKCQLSHFFTFHANQWIHLLLHPVGCQFSLFLSVKQEDEDERTRGKKTKRERDSNPEKKRNTLTVTRIAAFTTIICLWCQRCQVLSPFSSFLILAMAWENIIHLVKLVSSRLVTLASLAWVYYFSLLFLLYFVLYFSSNPSLPFAIFLLHSWNTHFRLVKQTFTLEWLTWELYLNLMTWNRITGFK